MKLADYIMEKYIGELSEASDDAIIDAFFAFLDTINPDDLNDEQLEAYDNVMAMFDEMEAGEDEEEDEENVSEVRKIRIDRKERRKHKLFYRKNKAKIKAYQKKYRKTAAYRKMLKLRKKRMKMGKTVTYI